MISLGTQAGTPSAGRRSPGRPLHTRLQQPVPLLLSPPQIHTCRSVHTCWTDSAGRAVLQAAAAPPSTSGSPLVVIKRLERFKLAALLAEAGQLAVDVQAQAAHVLLTHAEALVVRLLICQEPLAALHLRGVCRRWRRSSRIVTP